MCNLIKSVRFVIVIVLLFLTTYVSAKPYSLGAYSRGESAGSQYLSLSVGPQAFFGDMFIYRIKNSVSPLGFSPAATLGYRYQYNSLLGFKGKLLVGTLLSPQYDISDFNTPLSRFYGGISGGVEFEVLQIPETYDNGSQQLVLGVGVGLYVSTANMDKDLLVKSVSGEMSTPANEMKVSFAFPVSLAYYYPLSKQIHVFAEGTATLLSSEVDIQTRKDLVFNGTLSLQLGVSYKF